MTLIRAKPAAEQAAHFARLAQIAGDNVFSLMFGARAKPLLESMFLLPDNECSHLHTTFLLEDDAIAGMLHAYPGEDARRQAARSNWLYLRYAAWQLPRFMTVAFMLRDVLDFLGGDLNADDFYISMLALYSPYRGRGHGKSLLREAERLAVGRGCSRLTLDVDERNRIARAAYRKAGFEQIAESKKIEEKGERWGLLRLAKTLDASSPPPAPAT